MTSALVATCNPATTWPSARKPDVTSEFVALNLPRIEARLADECEALGGHLRGLDEVLRTAVGTNGRGGARWRPLLTLAAAHACGEAASAGMDAAIAVELTHTASLVLDDLPCMDDASERRGQPATHRLVGSAGAILLSVGLLSRSTELLGRQPDCGGALSADWGITVGLAGMAGGQAMDVAASRPLRGAQRRLHRTKSSVLPALALGCGARIAGAPEATRMGLEAFGRGLGWAYQLLDDVEDETEDSAIGRPSEAKHSMTRAERLIHASHRRLASVPGLSLDGRAVLAGLAARITARPALPHDGAPLTSKGRA
jgi:geranylgeranyl diphosphate synthase type II